MLPIPGCDVHYIKNYGHNTAVAIFETKLVAPRVYISFFNVMRTLITLCGSDIMTNILQIGVDNVFQRIISDYRLQHFTEI